MKNKWYKKWWVWLVIIAFIIFASTVIVYFNYKKLMESEVYVSTVEYTTKTYETEYIIPGKPAVKEETKTTTPTYTIQRGIQVIGEDVDIPSGSYKVTCESGKGNVIIRDTLGRLKVNEIMAQIESDRYISVYNGYRLNQGDEIETDCVLKLEGKPKEEVVKEGKPEEPEKTVKETVTVIDAKDENIEDIITCYSKISFTTSSYEIEKNECDQLEKIDSNKPKEEFLKEEITTTEKMYTFEEEKELIYYQINDNELTKETADLKFESELKNKKPSETKKFNDVLPMDFNEYLEQEDFI